MRLPISTSLPNRPETAAGLLDHGFELYARTFKKVAPIVLMALVPSLLNAFFGERLVNALFTPNKATLVWLLPAILAVALISLGFNNAAILRTGVLARGSDIALWPALKQGFQDAPRALGLAIMSCVAIFIAIVLGSLWFGLVSSMSSSFFREVPEALEGVMIVLFMLITTTPMLVMVTYTLMPWMLGNCAMVLLRQNASTALGTGYRLVAHNFWRSLLFVSVPTLIYTIAMSTALSLAGIAAIRVAMGPSPDYAGVQLLVNLLQLPVMALLIPLVTACTIALFSDLLLRRDGQDLQARLEALAR